MNSHQKYLLSCLIAIAALFCSPSPGVAAGVAPDLGAAESFAVLGASTVTCTVASVVTGDVGVSPGSSITGFNPDCTLTGTIHAADAVALQAHLDAGLANEALAGAACTTNLTGQDLGGLTLAPDVYCFDSSAQLTGTLYLTGAGPWIFKIKSTITTASNSSVVVLNNSGQACDGSNVFWQIGSSATLGTGTQFVGNIIAYASIGLDPGAKLDGSALALNGAVTLSGSNSVSVCNSGGGPFPPFPPECTIKVTGGGQIPVPDPDSAGPTATGTGRASFEFNAKPDKSGDDTKGRFNYLNHVTGLHLNGPVSDVEVIGTNPDGSPKIVRLSGTCHGMGPGCSFSVTVEDHGEPGTGDEFGIAVTGGLSELRSQRVISRGNIQFHKSHCVCRGKHDCDDDDHRGKHDRDDDDR
jgi:hypothetical protein